MIAPLDASPRVSLSERVHHGSRLSPLDEENQRLRAEAASSARRAQGDSAADDVDAPSRSMAARRSSGASSGLGVKFTGGAGS
jgi:hypothetical protein